MRVYTSWQCEIAFGEAFPSIIVVPLWSSQQSWLACERPRRPSLRALAPGPITQVDPPRVSPKRELDQTHGPQRNPRTTVIALDAFMIVLGLPNPAVLLDCLLIAINDLPSLVRGCGLYRYWT
jgi:hypothetical protein